MRKAARSLSLSLVLTALLGACQATPNSVGIPFQTQQNPPAATEAPSTDGTSDAARRGPSPRKSSPAKPSPATPRPKTRPSKPAPGGDRNRQRPSRPSPYPSDRYIPVPVPVPVPDREYPDAPDRQQGAVRITRVWTEDVQDDRLTIRWTTDRATVGRVEWGTTDFSERTDWQRPADTYHSVVIRDLDPDTEYQFRVVARTTAGTSVRSPELRARTEP